MDPTQTAVNNGGLNTSNLLGGLLSAGGTGLAAYNQQQAFNGLQGALNTIGPTQLNGYSLGGPGGMSSGYGQNGTGSIDLGSLNPAFNNLSGAAGSGSGMYNPALLAGLGANAAGTLGAATGALGSAYGNYNTGIGAANTQLGALNQTYGQVYNNTLGSLQAQQQPGVQQQAFGLQNTLFGKGVLDSTGATSGAIAAGNFGSQVNAMNAQDALSAQQQALSAQTAGANNYATLSNSANGILSNAFNNFGNTNQLISGLNTAQLNNSLQAVQGAGQLNTLGLNNYNAALQTGTAQASARNQSLFPYASVATALSGTQNGSNILANGLSSAGNSLMGSGGLAGLLGGSNGSSSLGGLGGLLGGLFGGGSGGNNIASQYAGNTSQYTNGMMNGAYGDVSGGFSNPGVDAATMGNGDVNFLGDDSNSDWNFNSAGGEAATGQTASNFQNFSNANVDAYSAEAPPGQSTQGSSNTLGMNSVGTGLGIYNGLSSGSATGYAGAGLDAAKLGAQSGAFGSNAGSVNTAAGEGLNALGIYNGLKQGGVRGDTSAAANAASLAGNVLGNPALSAVGGYVAAPLAVYNAVNNYKSGATGSDALQGAEAGAAVGSIIPGIGTLIGGVVGGAVGAVASAFGPGMKDPETSTVDNLINVTSSNGNNSQIAANVQNPYIQMAGLFDDRSSTLPMYQQYGRMGEAKFTNDFAKQINTAISSGKITSSTPASEVYSKVIDPWVSSMGSGWKNVGTTYQATTQGLLQDMTSQYMNGTATQNWKDTSGVTPFANIYQGSAIKEVAAPKAPSATDQGKRSGGQVR